MPEPRKTVFLSYSHKDRKWVNELSTFLAPWLRDRRVEYWDDSRIVLGANWQTDIEHAIDSATVAVPLVTANYLASRFVMEVELPLLIERARKSQLRLAWVAVTHSAVEATALWNFQAANDPSRPLDTLDKPRRSQVMSDVARQIADAATIGTLARGLRTIDETTEPFEAALEGRPAKLDRTFGVQAHYEAAHNEISFTGSTQKITAADLERLPPQDREFIADLEDSLRTNYERWRTVHKQLGDAGGALDGEVERHLRRIGKLICSDLNSILEFLRQMHKYELEDHYGRYRYICEKLAAQ